MNFRKYLVLLTVMTFGGTGDVLLARGMKELGPVNLHHPAELITAILNPWIIAGILLLIGFLAAYSSALSWADLTYVLPATAFGYVVIALLARFFLHESISPARWAGIALIVCGVSLVTRGPALTPQRAKPARLAGHEPSAGEKQHGPA